MTLQTTKVLLQIDTKINLEIMLEVETIFTSIKTLKPTTSLHSTLTNMGLIKPQREREKIS